MNTNDKVSATANEVRVCLDEELMNAFGDGTLLGVIASAFPLRAVCSWEKVIVAIPETTQGWKDHNGGPKLHILNEYTVGCVLKDVLHLISLGVKVEVETPRILNY